MKTLTQERFAPITSQVGFLEVSLEQSAEFFVKWRRELYGRVESIPLDEPFPEMLHRLEPLVGGARPRELLVSHGKWTAYFDSSLNGTDARSTIGHLSRAMQRHGVVATSIPHTHGVNGLPGGRMGMVGFSLLGPLRTSFSNLVRCVEVAFDGRWEFDATGTEQAFEEIEAYRARRVQDRFTADMLERYCREMGIDLFNEAAYGPRAILFESDVVMPDPPTLMTLRQAQQWRGIEPGAAGRLAD